jgi:hypothetical protein
MTEKKSNTQISPEGGKQPWALEAKATIVAQGKELAEKDKEIERLRLELTEKGNQPATSNALSAENVPQAWVERMAQLEGMVKVLSGKPSSVSINSGKPKEWETPITKEDIQEKVVTFSARGTCYVTSSYDLDNVRHVAPFRPIRFVFAGSDRRRVGKEEDIINYCVYSTNVIKEIEFLRAHPLFGLQFSENLNDMISADAKQLAKMTAVVSRFRNMSMDVLLPMAQRERLNVAKMNREDIVMELASRTVSQELKAERDHYMRSLEAAAAGIENMANH